MSNEWFFKWPLMTESKNYFRSVAKQYNFSQLSSSYRFFVKQFHFRMT